MKIDWDALKTEDEWQNTFDKFWVKFTPKWFEWLGWTSILAAIQVVQEKTDSRLLNIVLAFSFTAIFYFFLVTSSKIQFHTTKLKTQRARRLVSFAISTCISIGTYLLVKQVALELAAAL